MKNVAGERSRRGELCDRIEFADHLFSARSAGTVTKGRSRLKLMSIMNYI